MRVKTRRNEGDMPGGQGGVPSAASSRRGLHVVPEASTEIVGERASSTGVLLFSAVVLWLKGRARDALCTLPVLAVWAGLMLAVPSPSPRYALPLWQCALLFLTWTYYVPREPK